MPLIAQKANNRIILGLMTFGPPGGAIARITDIASFKDSLDLFQSRGYNEVDTARVYIGGQQEGWTAQTGWKERGLTLATKVKYPAEPGDNTAAKVLESVETSLKELGTDCIDVSRVALIPLLVVWPQLESFTDFISSCSTSTAQTAVLPSLRPLRRLISCTRQVSLCGLVLATSRPLRWRRSLPSANTING